MSWRVVLSSMIPSTNSSEHLEGLRDIASGPRCHFPGLYTIWKSHGNVASFRFLNLLFSILPKSLSFRIPNNGSWSVETIKLGQPSVNYLEWCNDHATANALPSVGEYLLSGGLVNLEPENINFHPVSQQVGVVPVSH